MVKAVLVIGLSQCETGLDPRLAAAQEVEAIRRIRLHPVIRDISAKSVRRLKNPTRQVLTEAIEHIFSPHRQDQLLILILSSQAIQGATGGQYPSTCKTTDQTDPKNNSALVDALAIAASLIHDLIDHCLAKQQGEILHQCPSSPFAERSSNKAERNRDVRTQLDGESWTIITSSPPRASHLHSNTAFAHNRNPAFPQWRHPALMLGVSAVMMCILALGGGYALLQTQENQPAKQSLEQAQALQTKANYADCVKAASSIPPNSSAYLAAQDLLKTCKVGQAINRLISQDNYQGCIEQASSIPALQMLLETCKREQAKKARLEDDQQLWDTAQRFALSHNFRDAVTHLAQISQHSPVHPEAQTLINQWSNQLLQQAANAYGEGRYDNAIALAQAIPDSSMNYQHTQKTIDLWRQVWESNTQQLEAAQRALEVGIWHEAISAAEAIDASSSYWRQQASNIILQADRRLGDEARKAAAKRRCQQYQTDYQQGVVDTMAAIGPKGGAIREKCADLGVVIAEAY